MTEYENMVAALLNNPKTNFIEFKGETFYKITLFMGDVAQELTYSAKYGNLLAMDYIVIEEDD